MSRSIFYCGAVLLLCLSVHDASANHLHFIPVTDTTFPENIPPWVINDTYGEDPLEIWVAYSGDDKFSTKDGVTINTSVGSGTVEYVFDASGFDDITNTQITYFFEFEMTDQDISGLQTIEIGFTDLINQIKWDEASQVLSANKPEVAGDDVSGVPRFSSVGDFPLRVQLYYHYTDHVYTYVIYDDQGNDSAVGSWVGSAQPFENFHADVEGTDPINLDIYPYVLCEARCGLTALDWGLRNCNTVAGVVDYANCAPTEPAPPVFEGTLSDQIEALFFDEHGNGDVLDVDANNGNGGSTDAGISYSIISGNTDVDADEQLPFTINPTTGQIVVNDADDLDVESGTEHFFLTVLATDDDDALFSTALVIVVLVDIEEVTFLDGFEVPAS